MVETAVGICEEYAAQGYALTLRQLYYQFVARGYLGNTIRNYKRLGDVINKARLSGMLDWDFIVDRTRNLKAEEYFAKPGDAVLKAARRYAEDLWADQPLRVEVWVEKEALIDVIARAARANSVDYFACRGYVSQSELWSAGQRFTDYLRRGQRVLILHLGDHDPSGIDMTRDIRSRLETFVFTDYFRSEGHFPQHDDFDGEEPLAVRRIALNMDQVEQYSPPPNPAKLTDSRAESYIERFGDESWELDALDPPVLEQLITSNAIVDRDDEKWEAAVAKEERNRGNLVRAAERWDELVSKLP